MSDHGDFEDDFDDDARDETSEEAVERLRAEVAEGEIHLRPELAEALMQTARESAENEDYDEALQRIDEAMRLGREMVDDGEVEFQGAIGRCLLFRAAVIRLYRGNEAALIAFNETIRFFLESPEPLDDEMRNELAVALVNRADLLIDPLGAHSAAIASLEQAVRIWRQLAATDPSYHQQLISTLLNCADAKLQSGDPEKALEDYRQAVEQARQAAADAEKTFDVVLIHTLMKLARLHEQTGNIAMAFDVSTEAVAVAESRTEEDGTAVEIALTPLYLQHGLLLERLGDPESALAQFDLCRDIYLRILDDENMPDSFLLYAGLANVLMCRGNMLSELRRGDEAAEAFDESVRRYRQAEKRRPSEDEDDTFIPYSIGVVRLNYANMLAAQGKLDEAVEIKEEALTALKSRYEAGHEEILPNLIVAFRKMIGIFRVRNDEEKTALRINELLRMLDEAVEEGRLEYRNELASVLIMRSLYHEEREEAAEAEKDLLRAVRLFRDVADEPSESQEVQVARIQWGMALERLAKLYARQNRVDDAVSLFQKAIDDVRSFYGEGNRQMIFDILLAGTHLVVFVSELAREESDRFSRDDLRRWSRTALDVAESEIELSRRQRGHLAEEPSARFFFTMKIAFFQQQRGVLHLTMDDYENAHRELSSAVELWKSLLDDTPPEGTDPARNLYYLGELRHSLQLRAQCSMALGNVAEAKTDLENDVELARMLIRDGTPDADRYLIHSLTNFANQMAETDDFEKISALFEEAEELLRQRFQSGRLLNDDFFMLRQAFLAFVVFLLKNDRVDDSVELIGKYVEILEAIESPPEPEIWIELCKALEIHAIWHLDADKIRAVHDRQRQILARHPAFDADPRLREYDRQLREKMEKGEE